MQNLTISCEFFPPRSEQAAQNFRETRRRLEALRPAYFSVTFGAGGTTQDKTVETVLEIQRAGTPAAPHLSCIGSTRANIRQLLQHYREQGIRRIVALRGDRPSGLGSGDLGELRYANELVEFIRAETGDYFHIEVAAYPEFHPQAASAETDLQYFAQKVRAGANCAITQYFYNADAYFRFVESVRKLGVDIPIMPGIMPIGNYTQLARFSDACGAEIPRWLRKRLEAYGDNKEAAREFGIDVVSALCRRLLEGGAPGLHFYTLNQADLTLAIAANLGLAQ
jgi:methylenetetrahydrofolate reductase (NADPH)